jgi:hypothetical protein
MKPRMRAEILRWFVLCFGGHSSVHLHVCMYIYFIYTCYQFGHEESHNLSPGNVSVNSNFICLYRLVQKSLEHYTGHTQKNGAVSIVFTI